LRIDTSYNKTIRIYHTAKSEQWLQSRNPEDVATPSFPESGKTGKMAMMATTPVISADLFSSMA